MSPLSDYFDKDKIVQLARHSVEIGDVFRMRLTREEGIIPKKGDDSRNKYFIVLGFDNEGNVFGGVVINSAINQNVPQHIKDLHMPLKVSDYPFLGKDRFVDCSTLMKPGAEKFTIWEHKGFIKESDVRLIISTVKTSPRINGEDIRVFGL